MCFTPCLACFSLCLRSFSGPDGDYYTSGIVSSAPFSLPYAVEREFGWAEGGTAVRMRLETSFFTALSAYFEAFQAPYRPYRPYMASKDAYPKPNSA